MNFSFVAKPHPIVQDPSILNEVLQEISVGSNGFEYDDEANLLLTSTDAIESEEVLQSNAVMFRTETLLAERYVAAVERLVNRRM